MTEDRQMKPTRLLAGALIGLMAMMASPSGATGTTKVKNYVAGSVGDAYTLCDDETGGKQAGQNIGGVCFRNIPASGSVRVSVSDLVVGADGGFWYEFDDAGGNCVGDTGGATGSCPNTNPECGTVNLAIPAGATSL